MLTTVLYRLEGEPDGAAGKRFDDVAADAWYARAVAWAAEEQIVLGTDNGFDPEGHDYPRTARGDAVPLCGVSRTGHVRARRP